MQTALLDPKSIEILERYLKATQLVFCATPAEGVVDSLTGQQAAIGDLHKHLHDLMAQMETPPETLTPELGVMSVRCTILMGIVSALRQRTQGLVDHLQQAIDARNDKATP